MRKLLLVLELAPVTWDLLPFASMATMAITRTLARLTASTGQTTLRAACLSAPAPGSMASTVPATAAGFIAVATLVPALLGAAFAAGPGFVALGPGFPEHAL